MHKRSCIYMDEENFYCDNKCKDMIEFFWKNNLKTYCSCEDNEGALNGFMIGFKEEVSDKDIEEFLKPYLTKNGHTSLRGAFVKWVRYSNLKPIYNWFYCARNSDIANEDLKKFKGGI